MAVGSLRNLDCVTSSLFCGGKGGGVSGVVVVECVWWGKECVSGVMVEECVWCVMVCGGEGGGVSGVWWWRSVCGSVWVEVFVMYSWGGGGECVCGGVLRGKSWC